MRIDDLELIEQKWLEDSGEALRSLQEKGASCPPLRLIRALQTGAMPTELLNAVSAHVAACSLCRMLQADLDSLPLTQNITQQDSRRILTRMRREGLAERGNLPGPRWGFLRRWGFVAAGLALCAATIVWQVRRPAPASSTSPVAIRQEPPLSGVPDTPELEKPPVRLNLALLTWRSGHADRQQFLKEIGPALDAYRADNFTEAVALLQALSSKYPDSVETLFYLGISRLFIGQFQAAVAALEHAASLADAAFASDVAWYLGLGYQLSGRLADARNRFWALCRGKSAYTERACAAVKELDRFASSSSR